MPGRMTHVAHPRWSIGRDRAPSPGYAPGMTLTARPRRVAALCGTLATLSLFATPAQAHRSGCHRWHSCPSDTGSYVCGDLGYTTFCGPRVATFVPAAPASPPSISTASLRYTTAAVHLRASPSAQGVTLTTLASSTKVNLILCGNGWCRVTWQDYTGYVAQAYLRP